MANSKEIDTENIDGLIRQFFGIFNNKTKSEQDWDLIFRICIPEARILKKNGLEQTIYTLKDFIEPRKIILTDGTLSGFEETEIDARTMISNNIAQRQSRYQKSGYLNTQYSSELGTKLFHLVRTSGGWKISFVTWEDDKV
jgi:hypothetical protein